MRYENKMHRVLILLSLLIVFMDARAHTAGYNLKFQLSQHDFADTLAIELVGGRVVVPVRVGQREMHFLFDTGAAQAVVYADGDLASCPQLGTIASIDAMGRREQVPLVQLPPLSLGNLTLTGCQATVHRRPVSRHRYDGILGFDLICKGLSVKIDLQRRHIIITDRKKHFADETGFESRYRVLPALHTPYVQVEPFRDYYEEALFDTGSPLLFSLGQQSFTRKAVIACKRQRAGQIEGRAEGSFLVGLHGREQHAEVTFLCLDSLVWGGFAFRELHTKTVGTGSHLGAAVLHYGAVTFLPRQRVVRFQPYDHQSEAVVGNGQTDKVIASVDGLPVAAFVWRQGNAYAAGLREGDVLLKIDGRELHSYDEYARFRYLIGYHYTFLVRDRYGFMKEVKMVIN